MNGDILREKGHELERGVKALKRSIALLFLLIMVVPSACLAADAGIVNHVMASKIEYFPGKGSLITGPTSIQFEVPAGAPASNIKFTSLDQVLFMAGTFKVEQNIVEDATGQIVAAASLDSISVKNKPEIRHLLTEWKFVAKAGLYSYQVVVNKEVIATFKISIVAAK